MSNGKKIAIVSGSTHIRLAKAISRELSKEHGIPLTKDKIIVFNNGERNVKLLETVRGAEVFIIQSSLTKKVDNNWTETLFLIDASRRAGASKVYLVQTILPYARQDRRETNGHGSPVRTSIGAYVVIKTYEAMGADGVITMKLHSDQIEGFFDNRTIIENIDPAKLFISYLKKEGVINNNNNALPPVLVAPDVGSAKTANTFARMLDLYEYVIMEKKREGANTEIMHVIGNCKGRVAIIYDDLIDTGGTVINTLRKLKEEGALDVYLLATHGVFSKNAIERLAKEDFKRIVVTDSIPNLKLSKFPDKFHVIPIAPMLAGIIRNIHDQESLESVVNTRMKQDEKK